MIADPPVLDGVVQERLICDDDTVVAVRLVGLVGTVVVEPVSSTATSLAKYEGNVS